MINQIFAITQLTLIKLKEPAFMILALIAIGMGYSISEFEMSIFQQDVFFAQPFSGNAAGAVAKTAVLGSFSLIAIFSILIGIFTGATEIPRDIDSKMIMLLLGGKPLERSTYLIGKYLGILVICIIFFTLAGTAVIIGHFIKAGSFLGIQMILRQMMLLSLIFPFTALTVAFSCFLPEFSAMVLTVIYMCFSFSIGMVPILIAMLPKSIGLKSPLMSLYYFFPNFYYYFIPFNVPGIAAVFLLFYSISITVIFLLIANQKLNSRDMI